MGFEDFMMVIVVGGIVLSIAYIRAEYILWRQFGIAERQRDATLRDLHAARLSQPHDDLRGPSVVQLQSFPPSDGAIPNDAGEDRRSATQAAEQRNDDFVERRARTRQSATQ